ncbi:MAG: ATP-binding cassette domain-containing protein [Candidatus Anstonellales archaeon]
MKTIIKTNELRKEYGNIVALDNLNIEIQEGEIFALLGPNGAGKTTTIKILATLLEPTRGKAFINGIDVIKNPDMARKQFGIVFQEPSSDELLTGYENLKLHCMLYNVPKDTQEKKINEALELVELTDRKNEMVKKYSGGMRRRLEIARALLHEPKVLFLDEPTLGLDPNARKKIWGYITQLKKNLNMTILLTTHYMEEAEKLADRVCIINRGNIVELGSVEEIKQRHGHEIVKIVITRKLNKNDLNELKKMDFITDINYDEKNSLLIIASKNIAKNISTIIQLLKNNHIENLEIKRTSLEDVFIKLTGKTFEEEESNTWFDKVIQQETLKDT